MTQKSTDSSENEYSGNDGEMFIGIVELRNQKLELEEKQFALEQKWMEHHIRYSEMALHYNKEYIKEAPRNYRRLIKTQAVIFILVLLIVLGFIGFCLQLGKDEMVTKLIALFTHIASLTIGLFIGKKFKGKKVDDDSSEYLK